MVKITTFDEQTRLTEEEVLSSKGEDWSCVTEIWEPTCKTFKIDLEPRGRDDCISLFLTLGCLDFQGLQWTATFGRGASEWNGAEQRGEIRRAFSVEKAGDDPLTSTWSNLDDPIVAKAKEVASNARVQRSGSPLSSH